MCRSPPAAVKARVAERRSPQAAALDCGPWGSSRRTTFAASFPTSWTRRWPIASVGRLRVFSAAGPVVVGRDARSSSPELFRELLRGIGDEGVDVVDLGLVATPMLYFAVDHLGAGGGIMITASHNPGRYNGFKICREHAIPVGEATGLKEIEQIAGRLAQGDAPVSRRGSVRSVDVTAAVRRSRPRDRRRAPGSPRRDRLRQRDGRRRSGAVARAPRPARRAALLRARRHVPEPRGRPAEAREPSRRHRGREAHRRRLRRRVRRRRRSGGLRRRRPASRSPRTSSPDCSPAISCGSTAAGCVLYDLRSSRATAEEIEAAGGRAEMCRVGHSFVKAQMRDVGAIFAGELSGHFYFRFSPTLVADDGIAAFVALLDVLAGEGQPLSRLIAPLRRYAASGEINRRVEGTDALLAAIEREHADAERDLAPRRPARPLRGLVVQPAAVQHRAGAPPEPRGGHPRADGREARRPARPDRRREPLDAA